LADEQLFELAPKGPFDLVNQAQFFGGFPALASDPGTIVLTFPVEGWRSSAAVTMRQEPDGRIVGRVYGEGEEPRRAWYQALACFSLDEDGSGWPEVGRRDPAIHALQEKYRYVRPTLLASPYEAGAGFIIGHRTSIKQKQVFVKRMAAQIGEKIRVGEETFSAFPPPQSLLMLSEYPGLGPEKILRLQGIAERALSGSIDRARLRALPVDQALKDLTTLRGIGPFFAEGMLYRAAGIVDGLTGDDLTPRAVKAAYQLDSVPGEKEIGRIAEKWRPYRMWTLVLLHIWLHREVDTPSRRVRGN
jgi:DNA-3-methyladenine glycosylase II